MTKLYDEELGIAKKLKVSFESQFSEFVKFNFKLPKARHDNESFGILRHESDPSIRRPYLRIDGRRNDTDFMASVYRVLIDHWKLPEPRCLVEVTGGAEPFDPAIEKQLSEFFQNKSVELADKKTWVITSGNNTGIMKIVGDAFQKAKVSKRAPVCIGIPSWPTLEKEDRAKMRRADGSDVSYGQDAKAGGNAGRKLNLGYDFFILVDKDEGPDKFGQEIDFRNQFIDYVEDCCDKMQVTAMVASGGVGTLRTLDLAVTLHADDELVSDDVNATPRHVVAFKGTGRAVAGIEFIFKNLTSKNMTHDAFEEAVNAHPDLLDQIDKFKDRRFLKSHILNLCFRRHMIRLLDLNDCEGFELFTENSNHMETKQYIRNNFEYRQCAGFVQIDEREYKAFSRRKKDWYTGGKLCVCGRHQNDHTKQVESFSLVPDDCADSVLCGTLKFVPHPDVISASLFSFVPSYSRFMRVFYQDLDYDHELFWRKLYILFKEFWNVRKPQMLIEVTGTAEDMRYVNPALVRNLKFGIVEAAQKAKAWLITGGANTGIMKLVGDAMTEYRATHGRAGVPCIGIATWGMLDQRHEVFQPVARSNDGIVKYQYKNDEDYLTRRRNGSYYELNPGHDFLLLVDSGKEERFSQEITFRTKFLSFLADQPPYKSTIEGSKTPLVLLVVGGGPGTMETVQQGMDNGRTVVILKGFGGCADFLGLMYSLIGMSKDTLEKESWKEKVLKDPIFKKLKAKSPKGEGLFDELLQMFTENKDLVTVLDMATASFDVESERDSFPLEDAILEGIFKRALKLKENLEDDQPPVVSIRSSFELSLMWNRVDFAQRLIGDKESSQAIRENESRNSLDKDSRTVPFAKPLTYALKHNQAGLFELLIESGLVDPISYLSKNASKQSSVLFHKLLLHPSSRTGLISSGHVFLYRHLVGKRKEIREPNRLNYAASDIAQTKLSKMECELAEVFNLRRRFPFLSASFNLPTPIQFVNCDGKLNNDTYNIAVKNLLFLELFLCRDEIAVAIWKSALTSDYIGTAVMASTFCGDMAAVAKFFHRHDLSEDYDELKEKWEKRAVAVIMNLAEDNLKELRAVLTRALRVWQNKTVMEIAYAGERQAVMAAPPVQVVLENIWKRGFRPIQQQRQRSNDLAKTTNERGCWISCKRKVHPQDDKTELRSFRITNSKYPFSVPPLVKFSLYTVSLFVFLLLLFGDVVHTAHEVDRCNPESLSLMAVVWIWALAFAVDAAYEIIIFKDKSLDSIITILAEFLIFAASILYWFACQISPENRWKYVNAAKTLYSLSCLIFWFKCFRVFLVGKVLGPKVWALYSMFTDVLFFSMLHLMTLFAFAGPIYALSKSSPTPHESHWSLAEYIALVLKVIYGQWWTIVDVGTEDAQGRALGSSEVCATALSLSDVNLTVPYFADQTNDHDFCNYTNILASILLMLFLLLSNIMLLNMLIAYLTLTVEEVHSTAEVLWKFERFQRVRMFAEKTILPPPFNLIEIAFLVSSKVKANKLKEDGPFVTYCNYEAADRRETEQYCDLTERNRLELDNHHYMELNKLERSALLEISPDLLATQ